MDLRGASMGPGGWEDDGAKSAGMSGCRPADEGDFRSRRALGVEFRSAVILALKWGGSSNLYGGRL